MIDMLKTIKTLSKLFLKILKPSVHKPKNSIFIGVSKDRSTERTAWRDLFIILYVA